MKMDLEYLEGILFITLKGKLHRRSCYKINNYVIPVIKKHHIKEVAFNLENLKSIDTSGIDALLNVKCLLKKEHGSICVLDLDDEVRHKLKRLNVKLEI